MTATPSPAGEQPTESPGERYRKAQQEVYAELREGYLSTATARARDEARDAYLAAETAPESGGTATPGGESCECGHERRQHNRGTGTCGAMASPSTLWDDCQRFRSATSPAVLDALAAGVEDRVTAMEDAVSADMADRRANAKRFTMHSIPSQEVMDARRAEGWHCGEAFLTGHCDKHPRVTSEADRLAAAREAVARLMACRYTRESPGSVDTWWDTTSRDDRRDEFRAQADELLSLPEVQALIGGHPSGVLAEEAELPRQSLDISERLATAIDAVPYAYMSPRAVVALLVPVVAELVAHARTEGLLGVLAEVAATQSAGCPTCESPFHGHPCPRIASRSAQAIDRRTGGGS